MQKRTSSDASARFQEAIRSRWAGLNTQAERALERARGAPEATRERLVPYIDQLHQTRADMGIRLEALKDATQDQFQTLKADTDRVTEDFRQAVDQLRERTQDAVRRKK